MPATVSNSMNSFLQFCTVLLIFLFVLVITWIATRWIANVQKGKAFGANNIEVIETYRLTANKFIQIIRAGGKYIVIATCKDTVTLLGEIPDEQIHLAEESGEAAPDFKKIFDKVININRDRKNKE